MLAQTSNLYFQAEDFCVLLHSLCLWDTKFL